jgi:hypothetical protein
VIDPVGEPVGVEVFAPSMTGIVSTSADRPETLANRISSRF